MKHALISSVLLLTGCVSNGLTLGVDKSTPDIAVEATQSRFVGVPPVLALVGSSVYLGDGWYITAAHNKLILKAQMLDVIYHPVCDVALFKGKELDLDIKLGLVNQKETTYTVGYPVYSLLTGSKGEYVGDFVEPDRKCLYSASTSVVISGMSGGGVWNSNGELVGIIRGVSWSGLKWEDGRSVSKPSVFTSINLVKDWIEKYTGLKLNK